MNYVKTQKKILLVRNIFFISKGAIFVQGLLIGLIADTILAGLSIFEILMESHVLSEREFSSCSWPAFLPSLDPLYQAVRGNCFVS